MQTQIELFHSPRDILGQPLDGAAAIVVDVLRASNSIITAVGNGCRRVLPVVELYEARALAVRLSAEGALLCGERDARMIPGFDFGNSPAEYVRERVQGRTLIFCSTNGSRAMVRAAEAQRAVVASFANLSATVSALKDASRLAILCAGRLDELSLEDTACGGAIVEAFCRQRHGACQLNDAAAAARALFQQEGKHLRDLARASDHGRYLVELGAEADIDLCVEVDRSTTVPQVLTGDHGLVTVVASST